MMMNIMMIGRYRIKVSHNNSSQPTVVPVVKVVTAEISCKTWDTNASAWKNSGCKVCCCPLVSHGFTSLLGHAFFLVTSAWP